MPLAGAASADGVKEISDPEGLAAMADEPYGSYRLTADIDMGSLDWTPFAFFGTLDGAGHTLYNLRVVETGAETRTVRDGNLKEYEASFAGLFSVLDGAELRDLNIRGALVEIDEPGDCFCAILAGCVERSSIEDCFVEGRVHMIGRSIMVGAGGLAGYGCGDFTRCAAEVELVFEDRNPEGRCEQFMGGLLACGVGGFSDCRVSIAGYDSCHGYVHDGGMVGMYYDCGMNYPKSPFRGNYVSGFISFFEDNTDRRAYCEPFRGEYLTGQSVYEGNTSDFRRLETWDYSRVLGPEGCGEPKYTERVTPPGCDSWGFTEHVCSGCGYSWTDSYTRPEHAPGDWESAAAPDYGAEGLERRVCTRCGEIVDERTIAALVPTSSCRLDMSEAKLKYGESIRLSAVTEPADASCGAVVWSSSDESVALVDEDGTVRAVGRGSAVISASSADGFCTDSCSVSVSYTFGQWLRALFGGTP